MPELIFINERWQNPLVELAKQRIAKNGNLNIIVSGNPNSGKTYWCLSQAIAFSKIFGKEFSNDYIAANAKALMAIYIKIANDPKEHVGRVVVVEEPQQMVYRMRVMTHENVGTVQLMSTFRSLNTICIMSSPRLGQLSEDVLSYFDVWVNMEEIDYEGQIGWGRVKLGVWNEHQRKMYWQYPRVWYKDNVYICSRLGNIIPPEEIIIPYEQTKQQLQVNQFMTQLKKLERKEGVAIQKRTASCKRCGYTWTPRNENPPQCPKCGKRFRRACVQMASGSS